MSRPRDQLCGGAAHFGPTTFVVPASMERRAFRSACARRAAASRRADRHAQDIRDLRARKGLDLVHHEHRTLSENELAERRLGQLSPLTEDEELVDGNSRSRLVLAAESRRDLVRVLPPSPIVGRYPHANAEQPRGHPTAAVETIEPAMCHDETSCARSSKSAWRTPNRCRFSQTNRACSSYDHPNGEATKRPATLVGGEQRRLCNGGVVNVTIDMGFSDRRHSSRP